MSVNISAGRAPTESELLEWMKIKPRTHGWDAWLAYDQKAVNLSLWRDYIERPDTHPFAGTITGKVVVQENLLWEHLYAVRLGAPQLSFEQSDVNSPQVTLTARASSGVQLSVSAAGGRPRHITMIAEYSPLQSPRLVADAFVDDSEGAALEARQVRLDLLLSENHQFSLPGPRIQQMRGGELFRKYVADLPGDSHHCLLNVLGEWEDGTMVPEKVTVRPLPVKDPEGIPTGEGAVLVMMAATGSEPGDHPDVEGDWKYPIPSGYNAALWIGSHCLMSRIVEGSIRNTSIGAEFEYDNVDDPSVLTVTKGALPVMDIEIRALPFAELAYQLQAPLADNVSASLGITRGETGLAVNWKTSTMDSTEAPLLRSSAPDGVTAVDSAWRINTNYQFARQVDGTLGLLPVGQGHEWFKPIYRQAGALDPLHYQHFPSLSQALTGGLENQVGKLVARMVGGSELGEVDRLRFEGLQCPGGTGMSIETVHLPRDLVVFGRLAAKVGAFVLSPAEDRILAGSTLQFQSEPGQEGLEWRVELVEGFEGDPGTISASGLYTAPAATAIEGRFMIVKVTAANAAHSSTAWLSVVSEKVALNPLVFVAGKGGSVRLSAGSLEEGELEWTLTTVTGASLREVTAEEDFLFDPGDHIYEAGDSLSGDFFSVDEVTVRTKAGDSKVTSILVVEKERVGTIVIREGADAPEGQVQLDFDMGGEEPIADAEWTVRIGDGTITPDGLYTPDPASKLPYAVITAQWSMPGINLGDYIILPIPLVNLDDVRLALVGSGGS